MQRVELDLNHIDFFCPVTGHQIFGDELFEPSAATRFVYNASIGELVCGDDELQGIFDEACEAAAKTDHEEGSFELFLKAIDDPALAVFSITTGGMACGPVWNTNVIGIDMNYPVRKAS